MLLLVYQCRKYNLLFIQSVLLHSVLHILLSFSQVLKYFPINYFLYISSLSPYPYGFILYSSLSLLYWFSPLFLSASSVSQFSSPFLSECLASLLSHCCYRSGVGAPVVSECEGEYHYDTRKNMLEWTLPVIDSNNESGLMEFTINGCPDDFFSVAVSFVSKKPYSDISVSSSFFCDLCV